MRIIRLIGKKTVYWMQYLMPAPAQVRSSSPYSHFSMNEILLDGTVAVRYECVDFQLQGLVNKARHIVRYGPGLRAMQYDKSTIR